MRFKSKEDADAYYAKYGSYKPQPRPAPVADSMVDFGDEARAIMPTDPMPGPYSKGSPPDLDPRAYLSNDTFPIGGSSYNPYQRFSGGYGGGLADILNYARSEPYGNMNPNYFPRAQTGGNLDYGASGYGGSGFGYDPNSSFTMPSGFGGGMSAETDPVTGETTAGAGALPTAQTSQPLDYGQQGYGGSGFGYNPNRPAVMPSGFGGYGMGRTGNPYGIGTGGMPQTQPYYQSMFGGQSPYMPRNPYASDYGGMGGGGMGGKGGGMSPGQTYQPHTPSSGKGGAQPRPASGWKGGTQHMGTPPSYGQTASSPFGSGIGGMNLYSKAGGIDPGYM